MRLFNGVFSTVRLLGVILVIAGIIIFLGNFTVLFPTIPGVGVGLILLGGLLLSLSRGSISSELNDWRHNE